MKQQTIGILGGGISGLSAAYFASQNTQNQIILLSGKQIGGWISTLKTPFGCIELGPRTIRPQGPAGATTLSLVHSLNLDKEMIVIPKQHIAAQNRFLYSHDKVQTLPRNGLDFMKRSSSIPAFDGFISSVLKEIFVKKRPLDLQDESIESFLQRRFSSHISNELVSAIIHGIYAGDVSQLSVKSTLPFLWDLEQRHGSVVLGLLYSMFQSKTSNFPLPTESKETLEWIQSIQKNASIYSFKNGLSTFSDAIYNHLKQKSNVVIINQECESIELQEHQIALQCKDKQLNVHRLISSLPAFGLSRLFTKNLKLKEFTHLLDSIPFVDVGVVNLIFDSKVELPVKGFGYLIPKSENAEILGVIFDSHALPNAGKDYLKLTVMMGGYRFKSQFGDAKLVSKKHLLEIALGNVQKHLGIDVEPLETKVSVHEQCIPQYVVGHSEILKQLHQIIQNEPLLSNRLSLVGSSYLGVGLNDCILNAFKVMSKIHENGQSIVTGLD